MAISISGYSALGLASTPGRAPSAAALRAQLAQYQKQLSDCVNCASSRSSEGQAKIQALSSKIQAVRGQIEAAASAQAAARPGRAASTQDADAAVASPGSRDLLRGRTGALLSVYA